MMGNLKPLRTIIWYKLVWGKHAKNLKWLSYFEWCEAVSSTPRRWPSPTCAPDFDNHDKSYVKRLDNNEDKSKVWRKLIYSGGIQQWSHVQMTALSSTPTHRVLSRLANAASSIISAFSSPCTAMSVTHWLAAVNKDSWVPVVKPLPTLVSFKAATDCDVADSVVSASAVLVVDLDPPPLPLPAFPTLLSRMKGTCSCPTIPGDFGFLSCFASTPPTLLHLFTSFLLVPIKYSKQLLW